MQIILSHAYIDELEKNKTMNQTHIHLIITHLPIFGSILGGLVLGYGVFTGSKQTLIAAYLLLIISSLGAGIAYLTGEGAEETVEKIPGIVKSLIGQHEDLALIALISLVTLGISSIFGIIFTVKQSVFTSRIAYITLFISLISFSLVSYTGYLGGKIRHTEIQGTTTGGIQSDEDEKK